MTNFRFPGNMRKLWVAISLIVFFAFAGVAQSLNWDVRIEGQGTASPTLVMTAKVPSGGHLYAMDNPQSGTDGANPLKFTITPVEGCELIGAPVASKASTSEFDATFNMQQRYYSGTVSFSQKLKPTGEHFKLKVKAKGQYCVGTSCFPVRYNKELEGTAKVSVATATPEAGSSPASKDEESKTDEATELLTGTEADSAATAPQADSIVADETMPAAGTWDNVEDQIAEAKAAKNSSDSGNDLSLWGIFIAGFLAGFIALLTPCVWPMIPMTVSFFLKQNKSKAKSIRMAVIYGLSIVIIYVGIGVLVTAIFGAAALNQLATSAIFNIIFFLMLVVFAISFLGGFEITLPSKWTNKMDEKADSTTGILSIFFMAFTLSLVSFSCTGPIIGTLLVEAASSGSMLSPTIGMLGFAVALAIPFTLFAMFPSWLKSMPKSGGWLNSVKVVLGFLELALALKFLSVADMAYHWHILDREVFLALWIVIFALLGVYLLGKLRFPHDSEQEKTGVFSFMLSLISFAFAVYMIPGLWGAPLKAISAFAPPLTTQDFNLYDGDVHPVTDDYDTALEMGLKQEKPILVDFSGYGCVNCRKMEGAVLSNEGVRAKIDDEFVFCTLFVDNKQALPKPIIKKDRHGVEVELEDYGELWSFLQENKFGALAQPYHVVLDSEGNLLTYPQDFTESVDEYNKFLDSALENYKAKK